MKQILSAVALLLALSAREDQAAWRGELSRQGERLLARAGQARKLAGEYQRRQEEYLDSYRQFIRGQAALLALELRQGEPCPVCGSVSHPAPARRRDQLQLPVPHPGNPQRGPGGALLRPVRPVSQHWVFHQRRGVFGTYQRNLHHPGD